MRPTFSILSVGGSGAFGGAELNSGLFVALASAAQVAADYSEDEERRLLEEERERERIAALPPPNRNITDEGQLENLLEVNRMLHGALAEKNGLLKESQDEIARLSKLLDRRAVEEPARRNFIEDLQARVQVSEPSGHVGRELNQMAKEITKVETKISQVNEDNLNMSEQHRLERVKMIEQQARLRTLGKRERELGRHLDYLAVKLNESVVELSEQVHDTGRRASYGAKTSLQIDKLPQDFKNLAGMRLNKLVGKSLEQPPNASALALGTSGSVLNMASPTAASAEQVISEDAKDDVTFGASFSTASFKAKEDD